VDDERPERSGPMKRFQLFDRHNGSLVAAGRPLNRRSDG
jgi:hypothetical protein